MAEKLTPQQQMAVDNRGGKLLVSAAAGSGKTKVLVDRLLKYVNDPVDPANIDDFLIITYTKAAAAELRGKIANKLSEHISRMPDNRHLQRQLQRLYLTKISTVHAFCADVLRQYAYLLDISADFRVGDENECIQLRQSAMDETLELAYERSTEDPDFQAFVETQGLGRNDAIIPQIIEQVYDSARCHLDPKQWCDSCVEHTDSDRFESPEQTVWGRFLMEDLDTYLDHQIAAMRRCADVVEALKGMEKPTALLRDTVFQLEKLRNCRSWDEIVANRKIDFGRLTFPKKYDDPVITEPVKAVRKACKEGLEKKLRLFTDNGTQILADMEQASAAARGLMKLVWAFSDNYSRKKKKHHILDFSDLEHDTLDLLLGKRRSGPTAAADEIASRFREIMVDEYQDSNRVQDAIFDAISRKKQNLFMVGDVKQSIYQFRLADPGIFLEKYASYTPAEVARALEGRKIMLSSNFRSGSGVIHAVNDIFFDCMSESVGGLAYGEEEALREGIPHIALDEPEIELHCIDVQEDTYAEEAAFVADRVVELLNGKHHVRDGDTLRPIRADDIVILLRSPGSVGLDFQDALELRGVRCASSGGSDLLLTEEVGTLRSVLQIISNPRQDIPLISVLTSPVFGFTAEELALVRAFHKKCSFYDALRKSELKKAVEFTKILDQLRRFAAMCDLAQLLEHIYHLTRFDTIYAALEGGKLRRENLETFYQLAADFSNSGSNTLDRFLKHLDTLSEKGLLSAAEASVSDCVTIMSIHKSKGLEFPVVFLCGLSKRFNQESLRAQVLCHKELGLGLSCVDLSNRVRYPTISKNAIATKMTADAISEEMRILYVALTRPKDRLIMTYASQNLEKSVADIASRMELSDRYLMTSEVSCPGDWVLYSALRRTEAGPLHALGVKPTGCTVSSIPWKITVVQGSQTADSGCLQQENQPEESMPNSWTEIEEMLRYQYDHIAATITPSKQTATQKKGRIKDQEVLEYADDPQPRARVWRQASFMDSQKHGTAFGNSMHAIMQYISYEACEDVTAVRDQIDQLRIQGFITTDQAEMADAGKIAAFFATTMGKKLRQSKNVLREFKFSILEDAVEYGEGLEGEKILLQGVVDCALVEDNGITVVDFKTDYVTPETLDTVADRYCVQLKTYAEALSRIFEKPVVGKALYFFRLNRFVWL